MSTQLDLADFTRTHTHRHDPDTSRAAARSVAPSASRLRHAILKFLEGRYPQAYAAEEVAVLLGLDKKEQAEKRLSELFACKQIVDSGQRYVNESGRKARCYRFTFDEVEL